MQEILKNYKNYYVKGGKAYYAYFKNGESLVVRLGQGTKPHLIDYDSIIPIDQLRKELEDRTYDQSGNYVVDPFIVTPSADMTNDEYLRFNVSSGKSNLNPLNEMVLKFSKEYFIVLLVIINNILTILLMFTFISIFFNNYNIFKFT
jgi:hypothetical protein